MKADHALRVREARSRLLRIARKLAHATSLLLLGLVAITSLSMAYAATGQTDAQIEARVMRLSHTLRCLVCQNQSIAESNAPLAVDLRNQVREQLEQGRSEQEIADYMVARYGDFVLYRPPMKASTLLLWLGPAALLLAGLGALALRLRRRAARPDAQLSEDERLQARSLLDRKPLTESRP
ncbi:cytochrome c-type biogenesis protein [Paracandidimonas soli]|uniref:Cytochrome c-type biogenesis protein n=1 Tax=Paracandidimonas soli TaxID=1917182 RepID=A0A4R3UN92_9BURK|nr:cytochrome c-type biogenesis protein CcmH [Paracandidimonas soli]